VVRTGNFSVLTLARSFSGKGQWQANGPASPVVDSPQLLDQSVDKLEGVVKRSLELAIQIHANLKNLSLTIPRQFSGGVTGGPSGQQFDSVKTNCGRCEIVGERNGIGGSPKIGW